LLHGIGDYTNVFTPDAPSSFEWRKWLIKEAEPRMASFGGPVLDEFVVERLIQDGEPAELIKLYTASHATDLITLPTHGRGIFRRLLLGSVTSKVLHDCPSPVWTAVHCGQDENGVKDVRTIVCAVDLTDNSNLILDAARKVACAWGAKLYLAHAIPVPTAPQEEMMNHEFADYLVDSAKRQLAKLQEALGTSYEASVETGDVPAVIRNVACDRAADLVIIGRGRIRDHFGALRTNVAAIIRESPCPVLSF
jgi:nucleotide-binding universal stress UspA family protein